MRQITPSAWPYLLYKTLAQQHNIQEIRNHSYMTRISSSELIRPNKSKAEEG